ncbi:hypothetical protein K0M31_013438 [Melipona bicolor]|uniref:Peptidase metallopeptidase domain-containing protein n=1 Tax=Melipona bicolor TaxID=60889 RepID=A0AA40FHL8_9HYME|nr:hypothetical protein K0M31_013438 [Melipona bicolor]
MEVDAVLFRLVDVTERFTRSCRIARVVSSLVVVTEGVEVADVVTTTEFADNLPKHRRTPPENAFPQLVDFVPPASKGAQLDFTKFPAFPLRTEQPSGLDTAGVRFELSKALDLWARNSKLTFQEVNSDRADILVYFHRGYHGDGYPFDGKGQILAHAFFPGRDRGGDVHFDEEEVWLLQDDNTNEEGTSLFAVAAHEFGHSLGLAHSSVSGALMYPWYQGLSSNYELPDDDRLGIQQMYGDAILILKDQRRRVDNHFKEEPFLFFFFSFDGLNPKVEIRTKNQEYSSSDDRDVTVEQRQSAEKVEN